MSKNKFAVLMLFVPIILSGCISLSPKKKEVPVIPADGGFYTLGKDRENNYTWSQDVYLATSSAQKPNFKNVDVLSMVIDPQDSNTIYVGTKKSGLFYTYDAGKNWFGVDKFKDKEINDIKISYKNKCLVYLAAGSELYKTEDCSRTWTRMFNDDRAGFYISTLEVDSYNEGVVYLGLSLSILSGRDREPDIIRSADFAESWQVMNRFPMGTIVNKILLSPKDTRIVYVATNISGLFKSVDAGQIWENITGEVQPPQVRGDDEYEQRFEKLVDYYKLVNGKMPAQRDSLVFRDMVILPDEDSTIIHASNYGLLRSIDGGLSWSEIKLIPPEGEKKAIIYSLAQHPKNSKEFYYGSDDTLFKTRDSGENWTTIKGPGTRAIYNIIATDNGSKDTNIYIGVYKLN